MVYEAESEVMNVCFESSTAKNAEVFFVCALTAAQLN